MHARLRPDIAEGQHVVVLIDLLARQLAAEDSGEDIAGIVGHAALLSSGGLLWWRAPRFLGKARGALAARELGPDLRRRDGSRRPQHQEMIEQVGALAHHGGAPSCDGRKRRLERLLAELLR